MKCPECGMPVPEMPEDASYEEMLCDQCYAQYESELDDLSDVPGPPSVQEQAGGQASLSENLED